VNTSRKKQHQMFVKPIEDAQTVAKYTPTYRGVDPKIPTNDYGENRRWERNTVKATSLKSRVFGEQTLICRKVAPILVKERDRFYTVAKQPSLPASTTNFGNHSIGNVSPMNISGEVKPERSSKNIDRSKSHMAKTQATKLNKHTSGDHHSSIGTNSFNQT
jgi:hypothetical protein